MITAIATTTFARVPIIVESHRMDRWIRLGTRYWIGMTVKPIALIGREKVEVVDVLESSSRAQTASERDMYEEI